MKADAILPLGAIVGLLALCAAVAWAQEGQPETAATPRTPLRAVSEFDSITDQRDRSIALFEEAGKVLQHPRCLNCHPVERSPTQGDDMHPHVPEVAGGPDNHGVSAPAAVSARPRCARHAVQQLPRQVELDDVGRHRALDSGRWALGASAGLDGLAGKIAGANLRTIEGSPAQRQPKPGQNQPSHG